MQSPIDHVNIIGSNVLIKKLRKYPVLHTNTSPLDRLLSPTFNSRQKENEGRDGGILPGVLHVISGPQKHLTRLLMRIAVMAQLPLVDGGVSASRVFFSELNNYFDPYYVTRFAMQQSLTPSNVLEHIDIARGFNWDQSVEIISRLLPKKVERCKSAVVLINGLTSWFEPSDLTCYQGLKQMIDGLKRCNYKKNVYMVATAPTAEGSRFKPRGGTNLSHYAGCIISVSQPRVTRSGSKITTWHLSQHPLYPPRSLKCWDHSGNTKRKRRRRKMVSDGISTFRTLEDFM